ncbi:MAG: aldo/keto reductase [Armatimonadota bacterium]|nr:aldo/keto reductase [bacterium]MDW8104354.1 aldo/keto reductase [Armatimonadota bacterium]MDW8289378.1 aldo/keto reductase [Armatimonadota bacterium]
MKYKRLGATGLWVSELCMGCMTFGGEADEHTSIAMVERCLEAGINFFDTANVYTGGRSEEILGKALRPYRDKVVIATKVRARVAEGPNGEGLSRYHIMQQVEASLRRLQTDVIDLYQVHSWDENTPLEETLSTLNDLVRQGKVRYIGCSNFAAWQLCKALWLSDKHGWARFDSIQPRYNLIDRVVEMEILPLCQAEGVGVMVYSPLAGGILTGKYRPGEPPPPGTRAAENQWFLERRAKPHNLERAQRIVEVLRQFGRPLVQTAIAWTISHPAVTCAIIGARHMEQLELILNGWSGALPAEEKAILDEASALPPLN